MPRRHNTQTPGPDNTPGSRGIARDTRTWATLLFAIAFAGVSAAFWLR